MSTTSLLRFEDGTVLFRQRLVLSLLAARPVLLRNIRPDDLDSPGLRPYEVSFLSLLDQVTNGSTIEINNTGTQVKFVPGLLCGGTIHHDCPIVAGGNHARENNASSSPQCRPIGWFLEGILPLAPFGKEALSLTLTGITDGACGLDPSVDYFRASLSPILSQFGIGPVADTDDAEDPLGPLAPQLKVLRRGGAPAGGGQVYLYVPVVKELTPIDWLDPGLIKRVRGMAVSCKVVSTSLTARVAYAAKGVLHQLLPDVWIHTDAHTVKHHGCGPSPALSLTLSAESTTGVKLTAECCVVEEQDQDGSSSVWGRELPDDLGRRGAALLLDEVQRGGCVDSGQQALVLLWMCLTPEDVNRVRIGTLTPYTMECLRLYRHMLNVEFKITADHDSKTVLLSCLGTGYRNWAKAAT